MADYDQVELRAIAHLSGDPGLTAAFAAGEDIHRTVAARVFGVDRDDGDPRAASTAKMVSYGLAYGMEAYGLAQRLGVPVEEAQGILDAFFEAFPSVHDYMDRAVAEARANGLHGDRLRAPAAAARPGLDQPPGAPGGRAPGHERRHPGAGRRPVQDGPDPPRRRASRTGATRSDLVLQVHDEVLVDVDPDEADAVAELTRTALTGAAELDVPAQGGHGLGLVVGRGQGLSRARRRRPGLTGDGAAGCGRIVPCHTDVPLSDRPDRRPIPARRGRIRPESELPT